jgi:hypothetical protein
MLLFLFETEAYFWSFEFFIKSDCGSVLDHSKPHSFRSGVFAHSLLTVFFVLTEVTRVEINFGITLKCHRVRANTV